MNFYFVFEGKTELIVYREWLKVLLPELSEVDSFNTVQENNYYSVSDMGVPDCYNVVAAAVQDINAFPKYDYLVLFTDADRQDTEEKRKEAYEFISNKLEDAENGYIYKKLPDNCQLVVIVQKVCMETWFLANRAFFVEHPKSGLLQQYIEYFDVSAENPEDLASDFVQNNGNNQLIFGYKTKAKFHEGYLREIFKEKFRTAYHKSRPKEVQSAAYLAQIQARVTDNPTQLSSFQDFINFVKHKII